MKQLFLYLSLAFFITASAQTTYYAAVKTGLSMRSEPAANAKVLEKIAYGQKLVTVKDTAEQHSINTEGFDGYWWKVRYNNKTGYVVSSYLLPEAAPKANTKTIKEYFAQLAAPVAAPVVIKKGDASTIEGNGSTLKKQLFKNGMEWHEIQGYEYGCTVYVLPGFTVAQGFLLLRGINEFSDLLTPATPFPTADIPATEANKQHGIKVERELWEGSKPGPVIKIKLSAAEAGYTELQVFDMEGQCVIVYSSGV